MYLKDDPRPRTHPKPGATLFGSFVAIRQVKLRLEQGLDRLQQKRNDKKHLRNALITGKVQEAWAFKWPKKCRG